MNPELESKIIREIPQDDSASITMKKHKLIDIPVFSTDCFVSFGMTGEEVYQYLHKKYHLKQLPSDTIERMRNYVPRSDAAITFLLNKYHAGTVVIFSENPRMDVIPHEAFHVTCGILEHIGVELNDSSDEVFAHLLGYLCRTMFDFLYAQN